MNGALKLYRVTIAFFFITATLNFYSEVHSIYYTAKIINNFKRIIQFVIIWFFLMKRDSNEKIESNEFFF